MQHFARNRIGGWAAPVTAIALALGGCSSDTKFTDMMPKTDITSFEWNPYSKVSSNPGPSFTRKAATPADFVNADGSCADTTGVVGGEAAAPAGGPVALQMTECALVQALGMPERIDLGTTERGERSAKLLYRRGERPGLYSFTSGLLTEIERVEPPEPPPKPQKKPPAKPPLRRTT